MRRSHDPRFGADDDEDFPNVDSLGMTRMGADRSFDPARVQAQNQEMLYREAMREAEEHRKAGRYDDAQKAYTRARNVNGTSAAALAGRGECFRMLGRTREALADFDEVLALDSRSMFALRGKGAALKQLGRYDEAIIVFDRALNVDPSDVFAAKNKAECVEAAKAGSSPSKKDVEDEDDSGEFLLDEQGRDLSKLAREGALWVAGREAEIRAVVKTLLRRTKSNPLLIGPPGVGKTSVVEGVAKWYAEQAPAEMRDTRIVELSMGSLVADTKYRGTFEKRLKRIVEECLKDRNIVLFIDEIHTLIGAGRTEDNSLDAANILKPALARGEIRVIGATTTDEYRKYVMADAALERRFFVIEVDEPSLADAVLMVDRVKEAYAKHHGGLTIGKAAVEACVKLSHVFMPDRRLPDKAFDILDEACVEARMNGKRSVSKEAVISVVADRRHLPVSEVERALRGS